MSDPVSVVVLEVVCVSFDRGSLAVGDVRPVNQYWSKDGRLLAEFDHCFSAPDAASCQVKRMVLGGDVMRTRVGPQATDTSPTTEPQGVA